MPVGGGPQRLIRSVVGVRGALRFRLEVEPRFGYGLTEPEVTIGAGRRRLSRARATPLLSAHRSRSKQPLPEPAPSSSSAAGERMTFVLQAGDESVPLGAREDRAAGRRNREVLAFVAAAVLISGPLARDGGPLGSDAQAALLRAERGDRRGRHASLPGANRRNAQLGLPLRVAARLRLLHLRALPARIRRGGGRLQQLPPQGLDARRRRATAAARWTSMYQIDGERCSEERELEHLEGYRGSRPVRVGNDAATSCSSTSTASCSTRSTSPSAKRFKGTAS